MFLLVGLVLNDSMVVETDKLLLANNGSFSAALSSVKEVVLYTWHSISFSNNNSLHFRGSKCLVPSAEISFSSVVCKVESDFGICSDTLYEHDCPVCCTTK